MLIVLQCEHIQAVENADEIFSVPGIDAIFVGPNDLAASMRGTDGKPPSAEETADAMREILAACKRNKVAAGVHTFSGEEAVQKVEEGWQFLAVASELKMMVDGTARFSKRSAVEPKAIWRSTNEVQRAGLGRHRRWANAELADADWMCHAPERTGSV